MGNIRRDGNLDLKNLKYLPQAHGEFPALLMKKGDLLFNRTNSAELVGKSAIFGGQPDPCSYASYLIRVRFLDGVLPVLAAACLNSDYGRRWIKTVVNQTVGQANVNGSKLARFVLPLPPLKEQEAIVREIEHTASLLDSVVATVRTQLERAGRLRQCILKRAFEGKLVPQDPNDEPASVLLDRQSRPSRN